MQVTLICAYAPCSKSFPVLPHQVNIGKYCSPTCYHLARTTQTREAFAKRFWSKVDKTPGHGPKSECWLWTGALHGQRGYGNFRATPYKAGNVSAHVAAWFLTHGTWPEDGLFVCHSCDVNACVAPHHLFLGTHTDNMQDMINKGRQNPVYKITEIHIEEARQLYATGQWSLEQLGAHYGVSREAIRKRMHRHNILNRS